MFPENDLQKLVVSVSGKRVSLGPDSETINQLAGNLPPEAAALLEAMRGQGINNSGSDKKDSPKANSEIINPLAGILPPEAAALLDAMQIQIQGAGKIEKKDTAGLVSQNASEILFRPFPNSNTGSFAHFCPQT